MKRKDRRKCGYHTKEERKKGKNTLPPPTRPCHRPSITHTRPRGGMRHRVALSATVFALPPAEDALFEAGSGGLDVRVLVAGWVGFEFAHVGVPAPVCAAEGAGVSTAVAYRLRRGWYGWCVVVLVVVLLLLMVVMVVLMLVLVLMLVSRVSVLLLVPHIVLVASCSHTPYPTRLHRSRTPTALVRDQRVLQMRRHIRPAVTQAQGDVAAHAGNENTLARLQHDEMHLLQLGHHARPACVVKTRQVSRCTGPVQPKGLTDELVHKHGRCRAGAGRSIPGHTTGPVDDGPTSAFVGRYCVEGDDWVGETAEAAGSE